MPPRALTFRRTRQAAISMMVAWLSAFAQIAVGSPVSGHAGLTIGTHAPAISAPALEHNGVSAALGHNRADRDAGLSLFQGADAITLLVARHGERARAETSVPARPIRAGVVTYDATAPPAVSHS